MAAYVFKNSLWLQGNIGAMRTFLVTWRLERPFWQEENVVCL